MVILITHDPGWADFGAYLGGAALVHPTPNINRIAKGRDVHQLVRSGELHSRPCLDYDRAHTDPIRSVGDCSPRRSERPFKSSTCPNSSSAAFNNSC